MRRLTCAGAVLATAGWALGTPETLQISLGTRETGSVAPIGAPGGTIGGVEWIDLDGQTLVLDGTWQLFTFDLDADSITPYVGWSADGVLDGDAGTLEHIRVRSTGFDGPITLWIDDVSDTIDPPGQPPPTTVTFGDFEGLAEGQLYMFQTPDFSAATSAYLFPYAVTFAGVDTSTAHSGSGSYRLEFQFLNDDPTLWVRLTTFSADHGLPGGDPTIRYDQDSVVRLYIKGIPEPGSLWLLVLGGAAGCRLRRCLAGKR